MPYYISLTNTRSTGRRLTDRLSIAAKIQFILVANLITLIGCSGVKTSAGLLQKNKQSTSIEDSANGSDDQLTDSKNGNPGAPGNSVATVPAAESKAAIDDIYLLKSEHTALDSVGAGETQVKKVCERNNGKSNRVVKAFCVDGIRPKSLTDLQQSLGLTIDTNQGNTPSTLFAITGHSSSLVARFVNAINPRVVLFSNPQAVPNNTNIKATAYVAMGFARGEQLVELIANNPDTQTPDFFLVLFKQSCSDRPEGCSPGELLTPEVEYGWTGVTLYQDEDLKNTVLDCRHCHQPDGLNSPRLLRMQELRNPWTHWFRSNNGGGGQDLLSDYAAAHGSDETYGGIPGSLIVNSNPPRLETFVRLTSNDGAHEFGHADNPTAGTGGGSIINGIQNQILDSINNKPAGSPGESAIWQTVFQQVARGERIPIPYHSPRITDPAKLAEATAAYRAYRANPNDQNLLKNMKDFRWQILRSEPAQLADMGFAIPDGISPNEALNLACAQCHNSKLDQSISRAKFNVDLNAMGPAKNTAIDKAIQRLKLGYSNQRRTSEKITIREKNGQIVTGDLLDHVPIMPPPRFKRLTDEQIDALVKYLQEQKNK
jgi:hypothetical protein